MLWFKRKYIVEIRNGEGFAKTDDLHGFIQQMLISPKSDNTVWSLKILDRDDDIVYSVKDYEGRLNERIGLPIGKDKPESFKFMFDELTNNEPINIVLNIKEGV